MESLFAGRGADAEFVVLYGSMARGDWSRGSDFDVLVGLRRDPEPRIIDRLGTFSNFADDGWVEALPYTLDEIERMFRRFNLVVLAALRDGVVLFDRGMWGDLQRRYQGLVEQRLLLSEGRTWTWTEEAERQIGAGFPP